MRVEILCTGDEILTGKTVNTNHSCLVAEHCWDQVRWALQEHAWHFERGGRPHRSRRR